MATVAFNPFLYLGVSVLDDANALVVLAIFIGNFLVTEANLFRKILNSIDPVVKYQPRVQRLGLGHLPDEIDGKVVSGHYVLMVGVTRPALKESIEESALSKVWKQELGDVKKECGQIKEVMKYMD